jgi:long-chain acyl-CoA synthetase
MPAAPREPPKGSSLSVHWPIIKSLARHPSRITIIDDQRSYKSIEILVGALYIASEIERHCHTKTLGILLPTGGAFPMVALAAWMVGKVVVPLNYLLKQEELQYVIDDCETDTVISAGPMLEFLGYRPRVKSLIELDQIAPAFKKSVPEPRWPRGAADEDLAILLYTSGTSGKPKGVMLSHGNVSSNIRQALDFVRFTRDEIILGILPQFHSFGLTVLTLLPITLGCRVIFTARFVPGKIVKLMREHKPTAIIMIPSMYNALLHAKDATREDFASLRFIVSGGEPLPHATFDGFREKFGVTINEGYGLTETSPATNICLPGEVRRTSVGRPLPLIDQRIIDPATFEFLPTGAEGEIVMRGPNVMQGYFKLPEETAKAFTPPLPVGELAGRNGQSKAPFFRTGDIGKIDPDGFLYITGRLKEMIIVGGENVFPREIEEVLNQHPAVNASGVIGISDPMRGEQPYAFVEFKEGQQAGEHDLLAWCRGKLAGYKVPKGIKVVQTLPRNPTGKIMRRELKKMMTI